MSRITAGLVAGFVATLVLSGLMLIKGALGLAPEMNVIHMLSNMLDGPPMAGWIAHFVIGTVGWGLLFVALQQMSAPRLLVVKGMVFATAAWLLMMVALMPAAGAGLFGLNIGPVVPVMTLVLHLVFGAVLGYTFHRLRPAVPPAPQI